MSECEEKAEEEASVHIQRAASPGLSHVSMKSNKSIGIPPSISDGPSPSPGLSRVSMKSNNSMFLPPDGPAVTSEPVVDHGGEFMISGLHKYACNLTLDPNTANNQLVLSEKNRKVTYVRENQSYPDHPDRFDGHPQVLCGESLTGRCYWEIERSGSAYITVSYKGIKRKGWSDSLFGYNDKSWSLICSNNRFSVRHNKKETLVSGVSGSCKRAGVFVDVSSGSLSFYSVSDTHTLTHLHTFNTTFTEPLYAGFRVYSYSSNASVSLCDIKQQH